MALILEVVDADGRRTRHQIGDLPLTLGRALSNDVIIDDPYVDPRHARVYSDGNGAAVVEDLGSVNGLVSSEQRLFGRTLVKPGDILRVGRTTLRVRDPDELLPPALIDQPAAPPVRRERRTIVRLLSTTPGRLLIAATTLAAFALYTWFGTPTRSSASEVMSAMLGFALAMSLWAGLWSVASRIIVHRWRFVGHLAIASAVALVFTSWSIGADWLHFFFPDAKLVTVFSYPISIALLAALVAGHLSLASTMPRKRQWRVGLIVSGTVMAIGGLSALTKDDSFSDVPTFSGVVKPVDARWVPTKSIEQFDDVTRQLQQQVDELAKK